MDVRVHAPYLEFVSQVFLNADDFLFDVFEQEFNRVLLLARLPAFKNALRHVKQACLVVFRLQFEEVCECENETQLNRLLTLKLRLNHGLVFRGGVVVELRLVLALGLLGPADIVLVDVAEDLLYERLVTVLLLEHSHLRQMLDEDLEIHSRRLL